MRRMLAAVVVLSSVCACTLWKSDDVLAEQGDVRILWRSKKRLVGRSGRDPIPKYAEQQSRYVEWGDIETQLWNRGTVSEPWDKDDAVELTVDGPVALYRRNRADWWAIYRGGNAIFQGVDPVDPDEVPPLRDVRAAIYRTQFVARESFFEDAREDGDDALVEFMLATLDAKTRRADDAWSRALQGLPEPARLRVKTKLLEEYQATPNTFVILRAAKHLDLGDPLLDEANRGALLELRRALSESDDWGVHHIARATLNQLACRPEFLDERSVVAVRCPDAGPSPKAQAIRPKGLGPDGPDGSEQAPPATPEPTARP